MVREASEPVPKLIDIAARDFPNSSEVLVSFPDRWDHIETIETPTHPIYVAGFPIERAHTSRSHFQGLSPEINVSLVFYRLYKFFQPWTMPTVMVAWDSRRGSGQVTGMGEPKLRLQPVGQAQAWFGVSYAVLWECYLDERRRRGNWESTLQKVWQTVEKDTGVRIVMTLPHDPAFSEGYQEFLQGMGYEEDPENRPWWSKQFNDDSPRLAVTESR